MAQRLIKHGCTMVTENDLITTENFRTFVDFFALKTRNIAIKSLTEGMTLNGYVHLTSIFSLVPSFLVNKLLFDDPAYDVDKLIGRFTLINTLKKMKTGSLKKSEGSCLDSKAILP